MEVSDAVAAGAPKVLVVEDNATNLVLVQRILSRRPDWSTVVATSGAEALALALSEQPAAILLDLGLPDMGGAEVLRRLRADARTAAIAVLVLTGDASPPTQLELERLGSDGFLTKPYNVAQLLSAVATLIERSPRSG